MSSATSSGNIVVEWLKSLHLGQYAESFLDNGYDDLEICKQVGDPDLDAIGVFNSTHRHRLLQSVRTLREEGAASVYFTLEESAAIQEECLCDSASIRSSRASSGTGKTSDKELPSKNSASAGSSSTGSVQELHAYHDEYEEGKAELVRIPRLQLKSLLKEKLSQDGIQLSNQPYSTMAQEQPAERAMRRAQDVARRRRQLLRPPGLEFLNLFNGNPALGVVRNFNPGHPINRRSG